MFYSLRIKFVATALHNVYAVSHFLDSVIDTAVCLLFLRYVPNRGAKRSKRHGIDDRATDKRPTVFAIVNCHISLLSVVRSTICFVLGWGS